eukprot:4423632-Amphidinium_carterae.1
MFHATRGNSIAVSGPLSSLKHGLLSLDAAVSIISSHLPETVAWGFDPRLVQITFAKADKHEIKRAHNFHEWGLCERSLSPFLHFT